jgi:hypothetical protein
MRSWAGCVVLVVAGTVVVDGGAVPKVVDVVELVDDDDVVEDGVVVLVVVEVVSPALAGRPPTPPKIRPAVRAQVVIAVIVVLPARSFRLFMATILTAAPVDVK